MAKANPRRAGLAPLDTAEQAAPDRPAHVADARCALVLLQPGVPPAPEGLRAALAVRPSLGCGGGLAVPFTVSRRSRRQGLRADGACGLRPSMTPDCLRCAVLATVPGNSARATGDRYER